MTSTSTETRDFLVTGTIKNIAALIEACDFPQDAYFLAEQLPQHVIANSQRQDLLQFIDVNELKKRNTSEDTSKHIDVASYGTGRIFCSTFELRWNRDQRTGKTQAVYLGSREPASLGLVFAEDGQKSLGQQEDLAKLIKRVRTYYLFGTTLDTSLDGRRIEQMGLPQENGRRYYAEVRIPRLLHYPRVENAGNNRRVQLAVCEYVDEMTGSARLFRFQGLKAAE